MTFGLKCAGATYQRSMNYIFHDLIVLLVGVYIDDIVVQSKEVNDHIADLTKVFERTRKYGLKMNPTKCAFGVSAGQFLGFIVHERRIEVTQRSINAIKKIQPPEDKKKLQSLIGKELEGKERAIFYLSRRLLDAETSQLVEEYECKNDVLMIYNEKCRELMNNFRLVTLRHVSREQNVEANDLAQGASGYKLMAKDIEVEVATIAADYWSKGHKFILVATDYFTKWVETVPLKKVDSRDAIQFVKEYIIYRFGIPQTITTDQGSIFVSDEFVQFADGMGIKLLNSSPYYAQANGQMKQKI
uniref:Retrotransposon protein, putative, unclassified n=1 Tax=Oryza sativa subsp. japonica TaxID=39947 RepID=Q2QWA1_ORYSJ|nr:retrotransposon protein, putative, unclassified [Oryza sativa Japonica Group]